MSVFRILIPFLISIPMLSPVLSRAASNDSSFKKSMYSFDTNNGINLDYGNRAEQTYKLDINNVKNTRLIFSQEKKSLALFSDKDSRYALPAYPVINKDIPLLLVPKVTINQKASLSHSDYGSFPLSVPSSLAEVFISGIAFLTNIIAHEFGHAIVADHVGAMGSSVNFMHKQGGQFFFGTSSVKEIDSASRLPYTMGGEFFADLTFEHALKNYRIKPTSYNMSLLLYSGTDFLWYCMYAFYLSEGHSSFDPITIAKETRMSRNTLFSLVVAKTLINSYRIYSGEDTVVPYFSIDRYSAGLNLAFPF